MKAYLGEYVITGRHNHHGRVKAVHLLFSESGESEAWLDSQQDITHEDLQNTWYSILCKNGGSVLVPERDIVEKEHPYYLNNIWEREYFNLIVPQAE